LPENWGEVEHAGMVRIAGGDFSFGSDAGYADERPEISMSIGEFWIDLTEVTVAQFADFVKATGYITEAERQGGGAVFRIPQAEELTRLDYPWWEYREGADWRHPQGPDSHAQPNLPVTLVTFDDAQAYAVWLDRELPSEAQWEYAAKAGRRQDSDRDREPRDSQGKPLANFWQGHFPLENTSEDGYLGVAPVGCYAANAFGLYDMVGNVWEQTRDIYTSKYANATDEAEFASAKPTRGMVIKDGSHLCAQDYCVRYRPSAREAHEANLPISHIGFRTVKAVRPWWAIFE
jgi:sulfatase modifying factor 1